MHFDQLDFSPGFRVIRDCRGVQAVVMSTDPGGKEGGPGNAHRGAEQWLFVVSGEAEATVDGQTVALRPGSLLLIERGEVHEIRNTGDGVLQTLNFYAPLAFTPDAERTEAGKA